MTTMDRLFSKGLLERRKEGRAFVYTPRMSPEEFRQGAARGLLGLLMGADRAAARPILFCIVESVSERDRDLLDDLERLVRAKRRALESGKPS
jgi:predicted transcriptional regulator